MAGDAGAADFLSSVEVLVAERADVLLMQNWAHVGTVLGALNRTPQDGHGVDMMRVRDWALRWAGGLRPVGWEGGLGGGAAQGCTAGGRHSGSQSAASCRQRCALT